jgi:hypothetical protein
MLSQDFIIQHPIFFVFSERESDLPRLLIYFIYNGRPKDNRYSMLRCMNGQSAPLTVLLNQPGLSVNEWYQQNVENATNLLKWLNKRPVGSFHESENYVTAAEILPN